MGGESSALIALRRLKEDSLDRSLRIEETQLIGRALTQHVLPLADIPTRVLMVDNCNERTDWKPQIVKEEFEKLYRSDGESDAYVFDLTDIAGSEEMWIAREYKFRLLADFATAIVVFIEPRRNHPSLMELSVLASTPRYLEKMIVLEPASGEASPSHPDLYDELHDKGRYFIYQSIAELTKICCEIYEEIPVLHTSDPASNPHA